MWVGGEGGATLDSVSVPVGRRDGLLCFAKLLSNSVTGRKERHRMAFN